MKIAALILEMNSSVDFLNLIQNVEEYNFDWICRRTLYCNVEELGSIRQHSGTHIYMESFISISVPYQIDVAKWYGFIYRFFHLFDINFSLTNKSLFWEMETIFIRYFIFCTFQSIYLKKFVELRIKTTSELKFSGSTGD